MNAILRIDGRSNDMVMLHLIETHCVPLLTYGIEIVHVANRDDRRQLRVAYNSIFRKIFGYRWSQSVSNLQSFLSRPTWEELVEKRQNCFHARVSHDCDDSLARLMLTWISLKFIWFYLNVLIYFICVLTKLIYVLYNCTLNLCYTSVWI